MSNLSDIKVLFLAKYAPKDKLPFLSTKNIYATYHYEIYKILKEIFPQLIPSDNPAIMLKDNLDFDFIFSLYNRMPFRNSEVFVSAVAEYHGIPYLGARPNIRALAEDKHLAKMLAHYSGVLTPEWKTYDVDEKIIAPDFEAPYFIKPRFGAASLFIDEGSICNTWDKAKERINMLFANNIDVILEKQIKGTYYTSPAINNFGEHFFMPCIAQHSLLKDGVVTHEQKRLITMGLKRTVEKDVKLTADLHCCSNKMFQLIQPIDYTRFDYIIEDNTKNIYFLEFNVCCNLGIHSTLNQSAASLDISHKDLITNITYSSLFRNGLINNIIGKQF